MSDLELGGWGHPIQRRDRQEEPGKAEARTEWETGPTQKMGKLWVVSKEAGVGTVQGSGPWLCSEEYGIGGRVPTALQ